MVYPIVRIKSVVAFLETVAGALAETCAALGVPGAEFRRDPAGLWLERSATQARGVRDPRRARRQRAWLGAQRRDARVGVADDRAVRARARRADLARRGARTARVTRISVAEVAAVRAPVGAGPDARGVLI